MISTRYQDGEAMSYLRLPVGDPLVEPHVIAKSLRNHRDRCVREETWVFETLAFCGISDGHNLHVLVSHPSVARVQVIE